MKTKNSHELSAQQKEFVRNIVSNPALFATHILGVSLWIAKPRSCSRSRLTGGLR
jgi:hypothetical protein